MKTKAFITAAFLFLLVALLHVLATKFSLYYIFWWYDNLLHIIGGMTIGFFAIGLVGRRPMIVLATAGVIGIAWEIFERLGHMWWPTYVGFGGFWDTIFDVLCGILGAAFVLVITRRK